MRSHFLRKSWGDVKPETIANCFRRAAFKIDDMPLVEEENESVDELLLAWARLQDLDGIDGAAEMFDYMHVDDEVVTDGAQTLEDIVEDVTANNNQLADSESMDIQEEDADPEEPPITSWMLLKLWNHSDALDDAFYQLRAKKQTQKKVTDISPNLRISLLLYEFVYVYVLE
uniref:Uncharacterized protein n=1 Tax=Ditylenchus dipsaci TaxID=166011 RepID=A0A915D2N2_9BILA